jgi:hypothetical protein
MKQFFTALSLITILQIAYGQNEPEYDLLFNNISFEQAKINNEDASVFFMHYPYNSTINGSDGNVFVSFIVRKDGQLDSIQILNEPGELFKDTALDALYKSSGHRNPCNFDGKPFDKKYIGCFNFTNAHVFFYKKDKILRLLRTGQTSKPLTLINQALKINPFDIELLRCRERIYRKQNKHDLEMLDLVIIEKLNTDLLFNIWF